VFSTRGTFQKTSKNDF